MNRKINKLAALFCLTSMALATGSALAADNATASATAVVIAPISVSKSTDMVFGNVLAGNGVITLSTSGGRTKTGSIALSTSGTTASAARFDVSGSGNNTFSIDYTGSDSVLTSTTDSGDTMAVDWIVESVAGTGAATGKTDETTDASSGTLSSGNARIYAGGKLTVGASQDTGTYTGSLKVTIAYN